jgi:hypothetical protein
MNTSGIEGYYDVSHKVIPPQPVIHRTVYFRGGTGGGGISLSWAAVDVKPYSTMGINNND